MRLLVVDHNALEPIHRKLYEEITRSSDITLRLIVPARWSNGLRRLVFTPSPSTSPTTYELVACKVLFSTRTHRLIYRSLTKHLRDFRPDVLYMNAEPENFQTFQAARLCSSYRTLLVFSSWRNIDHVRDGYPYKLEFLHRAIERYVLRHAAGGIVFNRHAQQLYARHGYTATTFIPPPVDTQFFHPEDVRNVKDTFLVGFVGRLVKEKGVDLLVNAIALLPQRFRLVIVGEGPEAGNLRRLAEHLRMSDRVEFRGSVSPEKLPEIYRGLNAIVLPSRTTKYWREQFGRVLVEAMACGVPVIGSSSGEIPEVIGDAGLVFEEGNVEGLREGLERLADDWRLWQELRERGLRRVREDFALERIARQMHDVFLRVFESTQGRRG